MNGQEMVVAIVLITAGAGIMRAKYGYGSRFRDRARDRFAGNRFVDRDDDLAAENNALRDEMRAMKERIQVLERLATDDESDARRLDREIEKLRDRSATGKTGNGE